MVRHTTTKERISDISIMMLSKRMADLLGNLNVRMSMLTCCFLAVVYGIPNKMVRTSINWMISRDPPMGALKKKRKMTSAVMTSIIIVKKKTPTALINRVTEALVLSRIAIVRSKDTWLSPFPFARFKAPFSTITQASLKGIDTIHNPPDSLFGNFHNASTHRGTALPAHLHSCLRCIPDNLPHRHRKGCIHCDQ